MCLLLLALPQGMDFEADFDASSSASQERAKGKSKFLRRAVKKGVERVCPGACDVRLRASRGGEFRVTGGVSSGYFCFPVRLAGRGPPLLGGRRILLGRARTFARGFGRDNTGPESLSRKGRNKNGSQRFVFVGMWVDSVRSDLKPRTLARNRGSDFFHDSLSRACVFQSQSAFPIWQETLWIGSVGSPQATVAVFATMRCRGNRPEFLPICQKGA